MPRRRRYFKKGQPNQILRLVKPFLEFMKYEAAGGLILLSCVIIALIVSNLPFGLLYSSLWQTNAGILIGSFDFQRPMLFWINDFLMVLFFFLIGLEIKREVIIGELSSRKNALAPIIGAIGGMIVPALLFLSLNPPGTPGSSSWAIPIATDIAITLGVLSIFGKRIPTSLKVFVTTLAITDDIGGVVIIALFYSQDFSILNLELAAIVFVLLIALNRLQVRNTLPYAVLGVILWLELLFSGIHPTITGVLVAIAIPATTKIDFDEFCEISNKLAKSLHDANIESPESKDIISILDTSRTLEIACKDIEAPLQRVEHSLTKWLAFVIVPIFALANAGIPFAEVDGSLLVSSISIGIIVGLTIGKPVGVLCAVWIGTHFNVISLPKDTNWTVMISTAFLTGIGFTISIFIASLAIQDPGLLGAAKSAILIASLVSGALGLIVLRFALQRQKKASIPYTPKEIPRTPNIIPSENNSIPDSE